MSKTNKLMEINNFINDNINEIIEWRRYLHMNPEPSFEEFETAQFIKERLIDLNFEVTDRIGGTGVVGTWNTSKPGPVIAFRADMDALPIFEQTNLEFESNNIGLMHACAHDIHMAISLGVAKFFSENSDSFCGTVKFIFQPAADAQGGAECIIDEDVLYNPKVDYIFALHVMPFIHTGGIGLKDEYMTSTDDEITIKVHGSDGHSSEPEASVNAITISMSILNALHTIQTSAIDPFELASFSITQFNSGTAINVIPEFAEFSGMIRCGNEQTKQIFRDKINSISAYIAESMGGKAYVDIQEGFPPVYNDVNITKKVLNSLSDVMKPDDIIKLDRPILLSEDFSYYQRRVPGVMMFLGSGKPDGSSGTLHSNKFIVDEECISTGIRAFSSILIDYLFID